MRLLGLDEEPVSVALSLDAARAALATEAEVLPWQDGLRVSRRRRWVLDPPEALLKASDGGLAGVVRVSWWVRFYAYMLPVFVVPLVTAILDAAVAGGIWDYLQFGLLTLAGYGFADTLLRHRSAKRELREWLCHAHQVER